MIERDPVVVRDVVVMELRRRPGCFVGRNRPLATEVKDALFLARAEHALGWMQAYSVPECEIDLKWRSVALAQEDERRAVRFS
jgi:hypothetical protein